MAGVSPPVTGTTAGIVVLPLKVSVPPVTREDLNAAEVVLRRLVRVTEAEVGCRVSVRGAFSLVLMV